MFIRVIYGARISLLVGVVAALVNFVVGVLYGGIAGYFGGTVDNIMMRIVDTISSIPMMLYVILLMVVMGSGLKSIILAMGLTYWTGMARIVRSQVLAMREQEFVSAAILLGVPTRKLLTRHLIPNAMGPIMVSLTMQIPSAMFTEAFLSFIGLGVSKPMASWGSLANAALPALYTNPYQLFYPALVMSITILALNLFSDGLRDSLDPRLRK
jgi:oligopeptide transport system permease protein